MEKQPYLYCPSCNAYPEEIVESVQRDILRYWEKDAQGEFDYQWESEEQVDSVLYCAKCATKLIEE